MNDQRGTPAGTARPLAYLGRLLILAVTTHAALMGCGGKTPKEAPPDTTTVAKPDTLDLVALGDKVYRDRCALCHGPEGKGDGPGAAGLDPKPRNHTDGAYMTSRTDEQLLEVIRHGKGGMPAWGGILTDREIQAVLKHVRSLAK